MNRYGYNFDWQENTGYGEIEALDGKTIAADKLCIENNLLEEARSKNSGINKSSKSFRL